MKRNEYPISTFCKTSSGGTPSRSKPEYYNGTIPWVKSGELKEGIVLSASEYITEQAIKESSAKIVPAGALLVAIYGATIGRVAYLGISAATNQAVCNIIPDESKADRQYLFHALRSKAKEWISRGTGGAQPNISQKIIQETKIYLPPLEEQKRIAAILDKADAIRKKRKQAIELTEQFLRSAFLDMFGDPITNPKGWAVNKLGALTSKIGSGATPKGGKKAYKAAGTPLIRSMNIHDYNFIRKGLAHIDDKQAKALDNVVVEKNDLLLNITGASVTRFAMVPETLVAARVNQHVAIIRCNAKLINPYYLLSCLNSPRYKQALYSLASNAGATREALTKSSIESLAIPTPPLEEQNNFEAIHKSFKKLADRYFHSTEKTKDNFNSLVQSAFRGEL